MKKRQGDEEVGWKKSWNEGGILVVEKKSGIEMKKRNLI